MCSNPVLNSHFPSFRSLPIQYTRQPKVFSKWGHHQSSFQSSELNQTQISMSASPVFLQPELMHKGFRTTRRLDVFSNACPAKDSDAHLGSRFHSCKLTDEKYQYADIMNCDPDSIGECFIIAYAFPSFISVPVTFLLSLIYFPILPAILYTIFLFVPAIQLLLLSCFEAWALERDLKTGVKWY